ncbi:MAG: FAD/NAD(P)-binding protein [Clostridiales Family XIII bacterium]|jgi:NAD(P)H-flavin reductase|nr:FAD/NAD(P)-binding protein [Clostridiales Family XIII bacterium]
MTKNNGNGNAINSSRTPAVAHDCSCESNPLVPTLCEIIGITEETGDVKTFRLRGTDGQKPFSPMPGQLAMISLPRTGEAMFSITSQGEDWIESSIKRVGELTEDLHDLEVGDILGVRGPYGNHFPVEELKGKNLLFVGGGIGLAPIRSLILYVLDHREDYLRLDVLYGSRSFQDLVFKADLFENWPGLCGTHITVDAEESCWDGHVGFVPNYLEEKAFSPDNCVAVICGPPIMIKFCLDKLAAMGFSKENIITTLEMRMKCGIGKCGRCNIGSKYVCLDGPVFTLAELDELPDEK